MTKKDARLRRAKRTRAIIKRLGVDRLTVHRTSNHIYVQLISPKGQVILSASTRDKSLKEKITHGGNIEAAKAVGELIANRCQEKGVQRVAFDRSGFKYHGRVKALVEAARLNGLLV